MANGNNKRLGSPATITNYQSPITNHQLPITNYQLPIMDLPELLELGEKERNNYKPIRVHCCTSTGCRAANSVAVKKNLEGAVKELGMSDRIQVVGVGCMGF